MTPTAFPLTWPDSMPRARSAMTSQFRTTLAGALSNVRGSINAFARDSGRKIEGLVISSNVTLGQERPKDPGVAVWFTWDSLSVCIAVDRYPKVEHNLQAIHHVLEARRTELRHGGLHIVRATFTGFVALPAAATKRPWRDVMDFPTVDTSPLSREAIDARYRHLASQRHPDRSMGSNQAMAELNLAREEALKELGL